VVRLVKPSKEHEAALAEAIKGLESQGYRVVKTNNKVPDAIATKDGKLIAVEIMGKKWRKNKGWCCKHTKREKQINYGDYDELLYFNFRYPKKKTIATTTIGEGELTSGNNEPAV
jgi:Holliday junction resolvase